MRASRRAQGATGVAPNRREAGGTLCGVARGARPPAGDVEGGGARSAASLEAQGPPDGSTMQNLLPGDGVGPGPAAGHRATRHGGTEGMAPAYGGTAGRASHTSLDCAVHARGGTVACVRDAPHQARHGGTEGVVPTPRRYREPRATHIPHTELHSDTARALKQPHRGPAWPRLFGQRATPAVAENTLSRASVRQGLSPRPASRRRRRRRRH